jgi:hypothetical protein
VPIVAIVASFAAPDGFGLNSRIKGLLGRCGRRAVACRDTKAQEKAALRIIAVLFCLAAYVTNGSAQEMLDQAKDSTAGRMLR